MTGEADLSDTLVFNGLDGATGRYLVTAEAEQIAAIAEQQEFDRQHLSAVKARLQRAQPSLGVVGTVEDESDLSQTGWGVIFGADANPAVRDAMHELLEYRRAEAAKESAGRYREFVGPSAYHHGETLAKFLTSRGASTSGSVDPDRMPYYLLIVGDPTEIPYSFQYQLDVQYAVGRVCFETLAEYSAYARSVVAGESRNPRPRRALFFGVESRDDTATALSTSRLVQPLAEEAATWQARVAAGGAVWEIDTRLREAASKAELARQLGADTPAFLFTASHGVGFPNGHPLQLRHQGALVCSDWPGPRDWSARALDQYYFSAEDVAQDADLLGLVAFQFACYGVGTPGEDDYPQLGRGAVIGPTGLAPALPIAPHSFVARLPQRLLGHPGGGALAVVGHVERALGASFVESGARNGPPVSATTFRGFVSRILRGERVGAALEPFNERYAETCAELAEEIRQIHSYGKRGDPAQLARMWIGTADARGYAIFGDPAARLCVDSAPGREFKPMPEAARPTVSVTGSRDQAATPISAPQPSTATASEPGQVVRVEIDSTTAISQLQESVTSSLKSAVEGLGSSIRTMLENASVLEVGTYVSDDLDAVEFDADAKRFSGAVRRRALTFVGLGGDTRVVLPADPEGVDEALWRRHAESVERAQAHRAELLKLLAETVLGIVGGAK